MADDAVTEDALAGDATTGGAVAGKAVAEVVVAGKGTAEGTVVTPEAGRMVLQYGLCWMGIGA